MSKRLGKEAAIIGAGSAGGSCGNGRATATLFAREGAHVVCVGIRREAAWHRTLDLNITSCLLACKHVLPHMLRQGEGATVNASSTAAARCAGYPYTVYEAPYVTDISPPVDSGLSCRAA